MFLYQLLDPPLSWGWLYQDILVSGSVPPTHVLVQCVPPHVLPTFCYYMWVSLYYLWKYVTQTTLYLRKTLMISPKENSVRPILVTSRNPIRKIIISIHSLLSLGSSVIMTIYICCQVGLLGVTSSSITLTPHLFFNK